MGCAIILIARLPLVQQEALQTIAAQCSAADQADQKKIKLKKEPSPISGEAQCSTWHTLVTE